MTNLNDIIDTAAKAYARKHGRKEIGYYALNFEAGASFATNDPLILQALLQPFGDWLWRNYKQIDARVWKERYVPSEKCYTIYQVIGNYIQFITDKSKEDGK